MEFEQSLRVAFAAREPEPAFEQAVMARVTAAGWRAARKARRKPGRNLLYGTLLALAAVAALLAVYLREPEPQLVSVVPAPLPATEVVADAPPEHPATTVAEPVAELRAEDPAAPEVEPFTVRLLLRDDTPDEESRAALRSLHAAVLARLRVVPGLTLVDAEPAGTKETPVAYRITLSGGARNPDNRISVGFTGELLDATGARSGIYGSASSLSITPACVDPAAADLLALIAEPWRCGDPASMASLFVGTMRRKIFPPDPSLRSQLQAHLRDHRLDDKQRLRALGDIMSLSQPTLPRVALGVKAVAAEPVSFVGDAIDLAATAGDATVRAQVWRTMRQVRRPELIQPLIDASREEPDGEARLEAVSTLARDFAEDQRVRVALETVARGDSRPLVRAVAQRGLAGEQSWQEYVVASLKDESRSDHERVEALIHYTFERRLPDEVSSNPRRALQLLDGDATLALVQTLPRLRPDRELTPPMLGQLLMDMISLVQHPAMTEMLLEALPGNQGAVDRMMAVRGLLGRDDPRILPALRQHSTDPLVRRLLEQTIREPDLKRREMALALLKTDAVEASATQ